MANIKPDQLSKVIQQTLKDYEDDVIISIEDATRTVAKAGVKELKQKSKSLFKQHTGEYAKGWKYELEAMRYGLSATLHNKIYYLTHLLENGHANRGGGRTAGRPHISVVEDQIRKDYSEEIIKLIDKRRGK